MRFILKYLLCVVKIEKCSSRSDVKIVLNFNLGSKGTNGSSLET
jgi:hypothetical protein